MSSILLKELKINKITYFKTADSTCLKISKVRNCSISNKVALGLVDFSAIGLEIQKEQAINVSFFPLASMSSYFIL
jgi:hypothetical protein